MLMVILPVNPAQAQVEFDVTGVATDSAGVGVSGAMVVVLAMPDSVLTEWTQTSGDGAFTLQVSPGEYILQVTLIGHKTVRRSFSVTDKNVAVGRVALEVLAVEIDPLVVSVEHVPFINQRDTLSFNALAFETRPNATVEDLLRRLPGIEVESDGSIKAQGEDVQNVLVDGREFFGSDPTIATKNLPADAILQIDVYDKESDMAEFTGIPDGEEERTINLGLKEEARRGYFGKVSGGLGTDVGNTEPFQSPVAVDMPLEMSGTRIPYAGALSINRFSPTTQLALLGNANNVNKPELRQVGGGGRGGDDGPIPTGGEGFNESLGLGLNASREFGAKSWIRTSYFFGMAENFLNQTLEEERLLGSEVASLIQGASESDSDNLNHRLNLNSQVTLADGHDFRIRGNLQAGSLSQSSSSLQDQTVLGQPLNSAATSYLSDQGQLGADGRLTWRKRLNESGRSIVAEARVDFGDSDQLVDLTSMIEKSDPVGRPTNQNLIQEQESIGQTLRHSVRLSLTEPLGRGQVLEIFGERNAIDENQGKTVFDLEDNTPVFNPILSSEFDRTYTYLRGGLRFNRNSDKTRLVFGLRVQNSDLKGIVLDPETDAEPIASGFTNLLPLADLRFQLKEGRNIRFQYTTSTREPSMAEFQPFTDNRDPLNIYTGNPDLEPEYRHRLNGEYRLFDQFSFVNLFTYAGLTITKDNISQSRLIDTQGRQIVTPANSGRAWSANGGLNFGTPIRSVGARIELDYRFTYAHESAFVNNTKNESRIRQNAISLSIENRDKAVFDVRAGGGLAFNNVDYSLNQELNQKYINPHLFADASYYLNSWTFTTGLKFQGYDQDIFGPNLNVTLWEASITRLIMNDRAEVQLGAYDLLNQNQGVNVTNSSSFNRTERIQSLGRYVMLRFNYHLGSNAMKDRRGDRRRKR